MVGRPVSRRARAIVLRFDLYKLKGEIREKIPAGPPIYQNRPNWPVPRAEKVLNFAAGRLPIRYRGLIDQKSVPVATPFRPVGTDFICVEQIARCVIVPRNGVCATLTKDRNIRVG